MYLILYMYICTCVIMGVLRMFIAVLKPTAIISCLHSISKGLFKSDRIQGFTLCYRV